MPTRRAVAAVPRNEFDNMSASLKSHLTECAEENKRTQTALTTLNTSLTGVTTSVTNVTDLIDSGKKLIWRAFVGLVGIILTVSVTILFQSWRMQTTTATKADLAVHTASRYTQEDAARDRAAQEARFEAILNEIRKKH